jgi:hypothetical protein
MDIRADLNTFRYTVYDQKVEAAAGLVLAIGVGEDAGEGQIVSAYDGAGRGGTGPVPLA